MNRLIGLNFHGIGTPRRALEPGEAPYWLTTCQFKDMLERVLASHNPDSYVLTFDDGNLSDYDIALPMLLERGLTASFFILSGRVDSEGSVSATHIRALIDSGMTVGSHGIGHVSWTEMDNIELRNDLCGSRDRLQALCGSPITQAGVPFGQYNARVLRALRHSGYKVAWSSDGGQFTPDQFLRARTSLRGDMDEAQLQAIFEGRMPPLRQMRRSLGMARRRWLPIV